MDISESTSIVLEKLQRFEPEYARKIIGYILMQDQGEQELINMVSYPDQLIRDVAFSTKTELQRLASISLNSQQDLSHRSVSVISSGVPSSASFQAQSPFYNPQSADGNTNAEFTPLGYSDCIQDLQKQTSLLSLENQEDSIDSRIARLVDECDALDVAYNALDVAVRNWIGRICRRFSNTVESPVKVCHYYNKGYCRHGNNCRYYHGPVVPETFSQMRGNDAVNDDQQIALAQLESEIVELLKSKGNSISIATLPEAYQEKYKKVLRADGYLTESQRHGKSGYNLARLLVKFRNSIRLIDRPHGQHVVVLAEDASKYKRNTDCQNVSASQQIYLTFPADSTFSEEDVKNYFSTFGCVEDVRIPCQQRRMFGFVTFVDPETVKMILDKGNPHYVRGSRVLVKPYKEKSNLNERKYSYRVEHSVGYSPQYVDVDTELNSIPRNCTNPRLMKMLFLQEKALEFQRRFAMLQQSNQKSFFSSPLFGINMDALGGSDDHFNGQPAEPLSYAPNINSLFADANYFDEGSRDGLNLPDSSFSFPVNSGISAVM